MFIILDFFTDHDTFMCIYLAACVPSHYMKCTYIFTVTDIWVLWNYRKFQNNDAPERTYSEFNALTQFKETIM